MDQHEFARPDAARLERAGASNGAQIRNGWSRRVSARIRNSHGTSSPANGPTTPGAVGEIDIFPPVPPCRLLLVLFFGGITAIGPSGGQTVIASIALSTSLRGA
jgi:hypothetical protein